MLLRLTGTFSPATDLGYLLHKNPARPQSFDLAFGRAHVFYPEASADRCTAALMLDIDSIGLVRGRHAGGGDGTLHEYVNDRPYVASSFLSVAIGRVFSSAMSGKCVDRPELAAAQIPLEARLPVVPCTGGEQFLRRLFEPLGYELDAAPLPLDEDNPQWGASRYFTVTIRATVRLSDLLTHLYVLLPVLDNEKHYYVGNDEVDKLLNRREGWLKDHPAREVITRRYLKHRRALARIALERLLAEEAPASDEAEEAHAEEEGELEQRVGLNEQRIAAVLQSLKSSGAKRVLDLGCGEGKLLRSLLGEKSFAEIVGLDVSHRALEIASARLRMEQMPEKQRQRIKLLHGSLMYRDRRLQGFDAAAVVEVIEHLDAPRLAAFERALFEFAAPANVVLTTPNVEYNVKFEGLPAGGLRHRDHRFEWTRAQFETWARQIGARFGYQVAFFPVGPIDGQLGAPTQMAVFAR
jgi:3' terminal RNA ribose 2'-O-methyltransferase Hen1